MSDLHQNTNLTIEIQRQISIFIKLTKNNRVWRGNKNENTMISNHKTIKCQIFSWNSLRKQWLDKQKRYNYQSEYDRIRGVLESSVLKGTSTVHLKERQTKC